MVRIHDRPCIPRRLWRNRSVSEALEPPGKLFEVELVGVGELEVALRERGNQAQLRATMHSAIEETDRIVKLAEEHDASVIVLGSHGRNGLVGALVGSVAAAVSAHSRRTVLITHRRD